MPYIGKRLAVLMKHLIVCRREILGHRGWGWGVEMIQLYNDAFEDEAGDEFNRE